jgi:hypothetical protein
MHFQAVAIGLTALALCSTACRSISVPGNGVPPIVGTWLVKSPEAPFPYHMFVFHSDGTMLQSNPDAGDPNTSDSNGAGVWTTAAGGIKGKFVEVTADRTTRRFVSRGEISFLVKVNGDTLRGTATAVFYSEEGRQTKGPMSATLEGRRVVP